MGKKFKRKDLKKIDKSFFDIDEDRKLAKIILHYEKFEDILEKSYVSAIPLLSNDFMTSIVDAFKLVSSKYNIDLTIQIDNTEGYTEEQLSEILEKNFMLEIHSSDSYNKKRQRIGYILIMIGIGFLMAMLATEYIWTEESLLRDIFFYIFDISTTVSFWEAMSILVVEQAEIRSVKKIFKKQVSAIHFTT